MRLVGGMGSPEEPRLPPGYSLDRSDPDVLVLLCPDGKAVARFSARGAEGALGVIPIPRRGKEDAYASSARGHVTNSPASRRTSAR